MSLENLKSSVINCVLHEPFVVKRCRQVKEWKINNLTPTKLANILQDQLVKFRIAKSETNNKEIQWENECKYVEASMSEFVNWAKSSCRSNAFGDFSCDSSWAYADYLYMKDLFKNVPEFSVNNQIDWTVLGFGPDEGLDAAIWVGSKSAHTACHYDSYGFNVVYQVFGKKRWVLYPPSDTKNLYPTRLPYEESSVFSEVNMLNPDIRKYTRFCQSSPHVVILEPGDLLFVPNHWWHFVENLELSISVNAWFPIEKDDESRLQEAITQQLISCCIKCEPLLSKHLITNHQLLSKDECLSILQKTLQMTAGKSNIKHNSISTVGIHSNCQSCWCKEGKKLNLFVEEECFYLDVYCVEHVVKVLGNWTEVQSWYNEGVFPEKKPKLSADQLTFNDFVKCLTSPSVVESIATELHNCL